MSEELLNLFLGILYIIIIIMAILFISWIEIRKRKNLENMKKNISSKLLSKIKLTAKDISNIGKAYQLTAYQSRQVVYKIYSDTNALDEFESLKILVNEIEKEEPFDDLPDEVKPSMILLTDIIEESPDNKSNKYLLSPIVQTLTKYVDLKSEQDKLRKQTNRAYIITIISFIVGSVSFYFTFTSPSAKDIAAEIEYKIITKALSDKNITRQSIQ